MRLLPTVLVSGLLVGMLATSGCGQDDRAAVTGDRVRALDGVRGADVTVVKATKAQPGIRVRPDPGLDGVALLALAREIRTVVGEERYGATASLTFQRADLGAEARISSLFAAPDDGLAGRLGAWLLVADAVHSQTPDARTVLGRELGVRPGPELSITDGDALTDLLAVIALADRLEPLLGDQALSWRFGSATAGIVTPEVPGTGDLDLARTAADSTAAPGTPGVRVASWHLDLSADDVVLTTAVALLVAAGEPVPPRDAVTVATWGEALAPYVDRRLQALARVAGDRTVSVQVSRASDLADPLAQWTSAGDLPESFSRAPRQGYQSAWDSWLADRATAVLS